jgi:hypothetical protein
LKRNRERQVLDKETLTGKCANILQLCSKAHFEGGCIKVKVVKVRVKAGFWCIDTESDDVEIHWLQVFVGPGKGSWFTDTNIYE